MKPSGIGGQAVIEGVMMKNKDEYAVAVRKSNREIVVEKKTFTSIAGKHTFFKLPILRGMLAFVESMIIGTKTLNFSASLFEDEEEKKPSKVDEAFTKIFKGKAESVVMGITMIIAVIIAVGIFIILPTYIAGLLGKQIESNALLALVEGCIRIVLFVLYVLAISQTKDIKRVFMYHGAEHKTINCLEQGFELTIENVKWQSRQHKRCGTSFMFLVMFISIIFFIFIRVDQQWLRYLVRILLVPVIAGVSYEFIRLAGKNDSVLVNVLSQPGMWLQRLTTREPDDEMIEVAITSVEAVFDWRGFLDLDKSRGKESRKNKKNTKISDRNNRSNKTKQTTSQEKAVENKIDNDSLENQIEILEGEHTTHNKNNDVIKPRKNKGKNNKNKYTAKEQEITEQEIAIASEPLEREDISLLDEEEDEILRALDYYLIDDGETKSKD